MGLFSRKTNTPSSKSYAQLQSEIRQGLEQRERRANSAAREAAGREAKWDRIVRNMTGRGEDHEGRDMAIRNRDRAKADRRNAEVDALNAKSERSNYRR